MNVDPVPNPQDVRDPRMRGFRDRTDVAAVVALIDGRVRALGPEPCPLDRAAGRILAIAVRATAPVPPFERAAMDGYALKGEETFGASPYSPALFRRVGEARPGRHCERAVGPGEAIEITTGSALPAGADTVVKVESTELEGDTVRVVEATPPGRHVGRVGEDIAAGTIVFEPGRTLRPQDLGVLSALGIGSIAVFRRPRVTVVVTGDEILPRGAPAEGCRIADMNSGMIEALIARDGGLGSTVGPLPDRRETLRDAIVAAASTVDALLISGGSSTGPEDHAPGLIAELGELSVHGVALRPASPAGVGFLGAVPVVLLPGNPVSCLCAYDLFAGPIVRRLGARLLGLPYRSIARPLARKLVSVLGRLDYARVRIEHGQVEPLAISGASILSSTTRADGFVLVPSDREGYPAGDLVTVWLYDEHAAF